MKQFFAPIVKIDKKNRLVHGILALEEKDKDGEIMDYEASKPLFEKWSNNIKKVSGGKSVGNLRVMHQNIVGGKFTALEFDDENKRIPVVAKVSNDKAWQQVLDGELNGFSIYGNPVWKKKDKTVKAIRYAVEPLEGSLVDNPCMHSATFTLVEENGQELISKFAGDKGPEQFWHCKKDCDFLHKSEEEAKNCSGKIEKNFEEDADDEEELKISKGMYDISSLASNLSSLKYIEVKGEKNKEKFKKSLESLFSVLKGMVNAEKDDFLKSLTSLADNAVAVKTVGMEILKEGDMKLKVKKSAGNDEESEDFVEIDEKQLAKAVAKSVATSIAPAVGELVNDLFEDIKEDVQTLHAAIIKMSGLPKKSKVVVKEKDKKQLDEDEEEPISKRKSDDIEPTNDKEKLLPLMKSAMRRAVTLSSIEENEEEEETEE